jgi:thioredoxin-like negative regulator of GroEL
MNASNRHPQNSRPAAPDAQDSWQVLCLCADWCGTCREWRPQLLAQAAQMPGVGFGWVDVEDQANAVGDLEIQTFPTLLIAQGSRVRFLGPVLPAAAAITRLLETLDSDPKAGNPSADADALLARLREAGVEPV